FSLTWSPGPCSWRSRLLTPARSNSDFRMFSDSECPAPGQVAFDHVTKTFRRLAKVPWREALPFPSRSGLHDFDALNGVDLEVEPGEAIGIIGRNGVGKSTFLRLVA